jgi:hypothetical protein
MGFFKDIKATRASALASGDPEQYEANLQRAKNVKRIQKEQKKK